MPKVGPFRVLAFEPLTPEAERLLVESVAASRERYRAELEAVARGRLSFVNTDFDTGKPPRLGTNPLTDETYAKLLDTLADRGFDGVPVAMQRHIKDYFAGLPTTVLDEDMRKDTRRITQQLAALTSHMR